MISKVQDEIGKRCQFIGTSRSKQLYLFSQLYRLGLLRNFVDVRADSNLELRKCFARRKVVIK